MNRDTRESLFVDLNDLDLNEVEILTQDGSRGMEHFAASSANCGDCDSGGCSCSIDEETI